MICPPPIGLPALKFRVYDDCKEVARPHGDGKRLEKSEWGKQGPYSVISCKHLSVIVWRVKVQILETSQGTSIRHLIYICSRGLDLCYGVTVLDDAR
jgi:hypothetical protein